MADGFHRGLDGLNEAKFRAFTSFLQLQNGGQVEPKSCLVTPPDDLEDDTDTLTPQQLSGLNCDELKKRFLDRIAEIASRDAGGSFVAAAVLVDGENGTELLLARNQGFAYKDTIFFQKLQEI
ncbi:hypothetical protein EJ08DRAFT_385470 [Tothia fuscella]|uniref:Uncharacterized protein n=1 Tax=Tothia fuscella TaxID=1048955 RepID=A0A9P4U3H8_9PEZI|nr:hypothetical protein EJ08DRAFT_385470 [Tothia fuscella]